MHQDAPPVNRQLVNALALLREQAGTGATYRALGAAIGVDHTTVGRWIAGTREPEGERLRLLLDWAATHGAPRDAGADYWLGVLYACEAMAETTHRLLREAREADAATLRARALAAIPPVAAPADPAASETPPPRRRRGTG